MTLLSSLFKADSRIQQIALATSGHCKFIFRAEPLEVLCVTSFFFRRLHWLLESIRGRRYLSHMQLIRFPLA